jgi:hypothetical protein
LKLRPVDEWNCMLVYTPANPAIHYLNPLAWVVFELSDGSSRAQIRQAYLTLNAGRVPEEEAARRLDSALDQLVADGLVIRTPGS